MRERFKLAEESEAEIRKDALEDWKFRAGEQWDQDIQKARESDDRPCFTTNRVQQIVRHVTNEQRQQRPAIEASPIGDGSDVETAEVIQGTARHCELVSDADVAYDTSFEGMVTGGFGYFRLNAEYLSKKSFDQEPRFSRVLNPFSVYFMPGCKKSDYSDAKWAFVTDDILPDPYKEEFPNSELCSLSEFQSIGDRAPGWVRGDGVRVAEYFYIESEPAVIVKGTDGKVYFEDELPKGVKVAKDKATGEPYRRDTEVDTVYWCKTNGIELLEEETEVACEYIPIVPVLGEEFIVEGRRYLVGVVRYARTPAQMYNLWTSAMAESIALAPKAPWLATPTQIAGFETYWQRANTVNWPYLPYNPDPKAPGEPKRQFAEPPIEAITQAIAHADADIKNVSSYDPSLALHGPEQSGKALLLRRENSDQANFGFQDNMNRAVRHGARIMLSMIQRVMDVPRIVRILNPDGTKDTVQLGKPTYYKGAKKTFDLTVGEYDISASAGPSYDSKRKEAAASIMSLVQSFPPLMQFCGDLLVRDMDWPQSQAIADRLKKMLPAQLQDPADGQEPIPAQAQQTLANQDQMIQKLTQAVHTMSAKLEAQQVQSASRERIALINAKAGILEAALKAKSAEALAIFNADIEQIDRQIAMIPDPAQGQEAAGPSGASAPGGGAASPQSGDASAPSPASAAPAPMPQPGQTAPVAPQLPIRPVGQLAA